VVQIINFIVVKWYKSKEHFIGVIVVFYELSTNSTILNISYFKKNILFISGFRRKSPSYFIFSRSRIKDKIRKERAARGRNFLSIGSAL